MLGEKKANVDNIMTKFFFFFGHTDFKRRGPIIGGYERPKYSCYSVGRHSPLQFSALFARVNKTYPGDRGP